jgi:RND family efflux transporter MFP subunit
VATEPANQVVTTPTTLVPPEERHGRRVRPGLLIAMVIIAGVLGFAIYAGVRSRSAAETRLRQATGAAAIPVVRVVAPTRTAPTREIVLPGTTQAFTDAPIFARTNGYVKAWYFDIGTHVKKGQLLAEIETPEIDQQLQQARADLETAKANLRQAQITAERWQRLLESDSVSRQETDQAVNAQSAMKATVDSNSANVRRLEQLQGFEKIGAPFDGVITARNLDIGVLVNAGAGTAASQELFHMAAIHRLRVFVAVPEVYARAARPGVRATLTLDAFAGRTFHGELVRTANAIDLTARTLLVEVDVDNPTGELLPGAYVYVHLELPKEATAVTIPVNALIFRAQGLQVGVVRNGKAELVPVTVGHDHGNVVEIVSGLGPSDQVIVEPSDSLTGGTPVRIAGTTKGSPP